MVTEFDGFATRMTTPLSGLALLLTGDRDAAATLVHTALTRAYTDRVPNEQRAVTGLVRAWLAGAPPVGEPAELPHEQELLRRSLDALPEKQRVAVVLHHWSNLSVPEIAGMVRRPERAVAADLAAGEAELHAPAPTEPDEPPPTVEERLAALVAAAGPPLVDLADVGEAGRAQRRQRRRTAIAAAAVLIAATTAATLLTAGEPEPVASERAPVRIVDRFEQPEPVVDDRARRLTAQLTAAMNDLLPDGVSSPEFAIHSADGPRDIYVANAGFGRTMLIFIVESRAADAFVPCSEPDQDCRYRQFPDGTVAEVVAQTEVDRTALSLTARRPDGTAFHMLAYGIGVPELTVEDMFRFATVLTY
jgi:DNA-directed RNA polymerase specialized sigma24 family protein